MIASPKGCGVGLRTDHYQTILSSWPKMDWFEAISENYMDTGGRPLHILEEVRSHYPVALHGVALSIGSADPLNELYLERLKGLLRRIDPFIVSDHLCWCGVDGESLHDLLPLPFTKEAVRFVAGRIQKVQDFLGRQILIENVSSYVTFKQSTMPEWEFLASVAQKAGCGILLDLNNIYVNSQNHGFDPNEKGDRALFLLERHRKRALSPFSLKAKENLYTAQREMKGAILNPENRIGNDKRLAVYANGYLARMQEALAETYAAVKHLLGDGAFLELAEAYAVSCPSKDSNLSLSGRHLGRFLKNSPFTERFPFLPDLAKMEWLIVESFHAFSKETFNPVSIQRRGDPCGRPAPGGDKPRPYTDDEFENLQIVFQPYVKIISSEWPILDLWNARKKPLKEIAIDLVSRPQAVLIYRLGYEVRCELLDTAQYRMLDALMGGRHLGEACEILAESSPDAEAPVSDWFSRWVSNELIARCESSEAPSH